MKLKKKLIANTLFTILIILIIFGIGIEITLILQYGNSSFEQDYLIDDPLLQYQYIDEITHIVYIKMNDTLCPYFDKNGHIVKYENGHYITAGG